MNFFRAIFLAFFWFALLCAGAYAQQETKSAEHDELKFPQFSIDRENESWVARELRVNKSYPYLEMAYRKERQGDLSGALLELEKFLKIDPLDDNVWLQKATLLTKLGRYQQARDVLNLLIERHPNTASLYIFRADVQRRLGLFDRAMTDLEMALDLPDLNQANRARASMMLVDLALLQKDFARALREARYLEKISADFYSAMARGMALSGLLLHEQALEAFLQAGARARNPKDSTKALRAAAERALILERLEQARELLVKIQKIEGPNHILSSKLGNLSVQLEEPQAAIGYFRQALKLGDKSARSSLVTLLLEQAHLAEARQLAREMINEARGPKQREEAQRTLAVIEKRAGNLEQAERLLSEAAASSPSAQTYLALARIRHQRGEIAAAEKAYRQSLDFFPSAKARYELSMLLAEKAKVDEAAALLQKIAVKELSRDKLAAGWKQIGLSAMAAGNIKLATEALTLAKRALPKDLQLELAEADIALERKKYAKAAKLYKRILATNPELPEDQIRELSLKLARSLDLANNHQAAISTYQRLLSQPGLEPELHAEILRALGYLHQHQGDLDKAAQSLLLSADLKAQPPKQQSSMLIAAGNIYLALGDEQAAAETFGKALVVGIEPGPQKATVFQQLAQHHRQKDPAHARRLLYEALSQPQLGADQKAQIHANFGYLALTEEDFETAEEQFRKALEIHQNVGTLLGALADSLARQKRLQEAKKLLTKALDTSSDIELRIALSNLYGQMNQPGLAVYHLRQIERDFGSLETEKLRTLCRHYGYYLETLNQFEEALFWYRKSLDLGEDLELVLKLAQVLRKSGRLEEARKTIQQIASEALSSDSLRKLALLKARLSRETGEPLEALEHYMQGLNAAQKTQPVLNDTLLAEFWYEIGGIYETLDNHQLAAEAYAHAVRLEPSAAHMIPQGYQELALDHLEDARRLLSAAVSREPDYLNAHQDLGYIAMQLNDNNDAIERFKTAIDLAFLRPAENKEDREALERDLHAMRTELSALENQFDLDLYLTYTSGQTGVRGAGPQLSQNVVRTDSGLELGWIPPEIGFRDHRILRFVGRLNWVFEPESLKLDENSLTGVLGVHYKPFKNHNLKIALEKHFGIGENAQDQSIFRLMGGLSDGAELNPVKTLWNYSYLFAEFDAYLEKTRRVSLYAEARQGFSWKLRQDTTLSPFVVLDTRLWSDSNADDLSFYEGGVGASVKFYFNQSKYELPQQFVELRMAYKLGRLIDSDTVQDEKIDALFATLHFHF